MVDNENCNKKELPNNQEILEKQIGSDKLIHKDTAGNEKVVVYRGYRNHEQCFLKKYLSWEYMRYGTKLCVSIFYFSFIYLFIFVFYSKKPVPHIVANLIHSI